MWNAAIPSSVRNPEERDNAGLCRLRRRQRCQTPIAPDSFAATLLRSKPAVGWLTRGAMKPLKRTPSRLRVGPVVGGHEIGQGDLGVFLRGGQASVAEQLLNGSQVGAVG